MDRKLSKEEQLKLAEAIKGQKEKGEVVTAKS